MGKRMVIIATLLVIVTAISVGTAFAFYQMNKNQQINVGIDMIDTDDVVKEVASFADLLTYGTDGSFNEVSPISSSRKVLKLTRDVTLNNDLVLTADVHVDLNGHMLNLNGHVLTFKHGYAGVYSIYGGTVEKGTDGTGYIAVDLVRASMKTADLSCLNNGTEEADASTLIQIVNMDAKYTAYSALYLAADSLLSDLNFRVDFKGFNEVQADEFLVSDQSAYLPSLRCDFVSPAADERCTFVYRDVDLPFHYLSGDIVISYVSSDTTILSNGGKLLQIPSTETDLTLEATVSCKAWGDDTYSTTFKIHVINIDDDSTVTRAGTQAIHAFLAPYYQAHSLTVGVGMVLADYYYEINNAVVFPLTAFDGRVTYDYETYNFAGDQQVFTPSVKDTENGVFYFEPNNDCFHLGVSVNDGNYQKLQMYSVYVGTLESAARMIINEIYGGTIIYDQTKDQVGLATFAQMKANATANAYIEKYQVTGASYRIKPESVAASYYTVEGYGISLIDKNNVLPKVGYVTVTFTFESGSTMSIDLYVNCYAQSGNTLSSFLPYYGEFDSVLANELTTTIEMPFCYEQASPYLCYDFAIKSGMAEATVDGETFNYYPDWTYSMPESLSIGLYYNGQIRFTFTNYPSENPVSMAKQLDAYLQGIGMTVGDVAAYGDAKYVFSLNAQKATDKNVEMILIYNYKFNENDSFSPYRYNVTDNQTTTEYLSELVTSLFTVKGGLFYHTTSTATNAVHDGNFFVWIYNQFKPSGEPILAPSSTVLIPTDWLGQDVEMDVSKDTTYLASVSDFTGINNLYNISKINLSGKTIGETLLQSIATMDSVTELRLSNCGLTSVDTVSTMKAVKILDISNNAIQYFDQLVEMTSLEKVYLQGNNDTNAFYGSVGICNSQAYVDLMRNGVDVYNHVSNSVPILYAESDSMDDYKRLSSTIYQDKLSKNVSIAELYAPFSSLSTTNFDLENTGGAFNWGYEEGETVYSATYFYVKYTFSGYNLLVKYYVERY